MVFCGIALTSKWESLTSHKEPTLYAWNFNAKKIKMVFLVSPGDYKHPWCQIRLHLNKLTSKEKK